MRYGDIGLAKQHELSPLHRSGEHPHPSPLFPIYQATLIIEHRKGSAKALAKWLGTYRSALMTLDVMEEAYNVLAKKRMERVKVDCD